MQNITIKNTLMTAILLLSMGFAVAAEQKAAAATTPSSTVKSPGNKQGASKSAAPIKVRLVDINSAGRNELMTLPGVTDAVADKIIASRPFGSKAQLTTRGILPRDVYEDLKGLVVAKMDEATKAKLLSK